MKESQIKAFIPNAITLLNLLFGAAGIVCILYGSFELAAWLLLAAALADFLDGMAARLLDVPSTMGKELDSLADMVSFGFAPGAIFYMLLSFGFQSQPYTLSWLAVPGFIVTLFAALRLAKFNLDTRQEDGFLGLPTPSVTLFTIGLLLIWEFDSFGLRSFVEHPAFLYSCVALLSWLMNSEIPLFSFKLKSLAWKGNEIKFIFAGVVIFLLIFLQEIAFSLGILLYVLIGVIQHYFLPKSS